MSISLFSVDDLHDRLLAGFETEHEECAFLLAHSDLLFGLDKSADTQPIKFVCCDNQDMEYNVHGHVMSCVNCAMGYKKGPMSLALENAHTDTTIIASCNITRRSQYERKNHFANMIDCFEGLQLAKHHFPPETFAWGVETMNKYPEPPSLNQFLDDMRTACKQTKKDCKLPAYYKHVSSLYNAVLGQQKDRMLSHELFERLQMRHNMTEHAFRRINKGKRKNFPNFQFLLRRLLEMENAPQYIIDRTTYLRTPSKVIEHNALWASICAANGWVPDGSSP